MSSRLQRLLRARYRISTQLYAAIGGAVALTIAASLVGWLSFSSVGNAQQRVNTSSLETTAAFEVAKHSSALETAAPQLTAAADQAEVDEVTVGIEQARADLEKQLALLQETADEAEGERIQRIRGHAERLVSNIEALNGEVAQAFVLAERREVMRNELATLRTRLDNTLVPRHRRPTLLHHHRLPHPGVPSRAGVATLLRDGSHALPPPGRPASERQHRHPAPGQRLHPVRLLHRRAAAGAIRSRPRARQPQLVRPPGLHHAGHPGGDFRRTLHPRPGRGHRLVPDHRRPATGGEANRPARLQRRHRRRAEGGGGRPGERGGGAHAAGDGRLGAGNQQGPLPAAGHQRRKRHRRRPHRVAVRRAFAAAPPPDALRLDAPHGGRRAGDPSGDWGPRRGGGDGSGAGGVPPALPGGAAAGHGGAARGRTPGQERRAGEGARRPPARPEPDCHAREVGRARSVDRGRRPRDQEPPKLRH